jgi:hypothetical protein
MSSMIRETEVIVGLEIEVAKNQEVESLLASLAAQRAHFIQLASLYYTAADVVAQQQEFGWPSPNRPPGACGAPPGVVALKMRAWVP